MDRISKYIGCHLPVTLCNLKCPYCYIGSNPAWKDGRKGLPEFKYDINLLRKALSSERLGGPCFIHLCGAGETLIPDEAMDITRILLENGHYVFVITNGTLTKRFDEFAGFPKELRKRLGFKFSYHYLELKRTGLLDTFYNNINMMKESGCSVTVELIPADNLIPYIAEIRESSLKNLGTLCHLSLPRDESKKDKRLMTDLTNEEFYSTWKDFKSPLFDYKMSGYGIRRRDFCYAGDWSYIIDLGDGTLKQCYQSNIQDNIFNEMDKPLRKMPVGNFCRDAYCYSDHVFLSLGDIPALETPCHSLLRNRVCRDGTEWLTPEMKSFLNGKLAAGNDEYNTFNKLRYNAENAIHVASNLLVRIIRKIKRTIKK